MARLIDADKFGMYLADVQLANRGWRDDVCELLDDVMYALEEESAIDAVEVVRCKDCIRRYDTDECPMCYLFEGQYYEYTNGNGYCDRGK